MDNEIGLCATTLVCFCSVCLWISVRQITSLKVHGVWDFHAFITVSQCAVQCNLAVESPGCNLPLISCCNRDFGPTNNSMVHPMFAWLKIQVSTCNSSLVAIQPWPNQQLCSPSMCLTIPALSVGPHHLLELGNPIIFCSPFLLSGASAVLLQGRSSWGPHPVYFTVNLQSSHDF